MINETNSNFDYYNISLFCSNNRCTRNINGRVIDGVLKDVIGKVDRYHKQQRIAIIIDGLIIIASAYFPNAFLEKSQIEWLYN